MGRVKQEGRHSTVINTERQVTRANLGHLVLVADAALPRWGNAGGQNGQIPIIPGAQSRESGVWTSSALWLTWCVTIWGGDLAKITHSRGTLIVRFYPWAYGLTSSGHGRVGLGALVGSGIQSHPPSVLRRRFAFLLVMVVFDTASADDPNELLVIMIILPYVRVPYYS